MTRSGPRQRHCRLPLTWSAVLLVGMGTWNPAQAQQAEMRMSRRPHYVGVPVQIEITAEGFEDSPEPQITVPNPAGGKLTFLGRTGSNRSTIIINGSMTVDVSQTFSYRFTADKPGRYTVGPFTVNQGSARARVRATTLQIQDVPMSDLVRIRMIVPEKPVYVGQRVPVAVEWWVRESERANLLERLSYDFVVPLFTMESAFSFVDREAVRGDNKLTFPNGSGEVELKVDIARRTADGETYLVLTAPRTLIPLKEGEYDLGRAAITADRITGWTRDRSSFFPRRTPQYEKIGARDLQRRLVVSQLPLAGKPQSFAGAVGRGFSLEASANLTVVQIGDPITLALTLRGEGSLETAGLPNLSADDGLDPAQFRMPSGESTGIIQDDGSKIFEVKVRVMDPNVREIPGIAYSWFDTEKGKYETTRSRPIALSVRSGEIVTARDAVGGSSDGASSAQNGERTAASVTSEGSGPSHPTFTLTGADLSLSTGTAVLMKRARDSSNPLLLALLYGMPAALLGVAFVSRRRADIDPAVARRRRILVDCDQRVRAARGRPQREGAREVATALRELVAEVPDVRTAEFDTLLSECDVVVFNPGNDEHHAVDDGVAERAAALTHQARERLW